MTSLAWKINRLRNMSVPEFFYRGKKSVRANIERVAWPLLGGPMPASSISSSHQMFPSADLWSDGWNEKFAPETDRLEDLLNGNLVFFGGTPLDIGQPPRWHQDPSTGVEAPRQFGKGIDYRDDRIVGNIKILWELNRHQYLVPLTVAYVVTGEEKYRVTLKEHLESWVRENPAGIGINWCSSLELSLRLISWSIVHCLLVAKDKQHGIFDLLDAGILGVSIHQHIHFVIHHLSRYSSANNHLIGELTGIWIATSVFNLGASGRKWSSFAKQELELEARQQVHEDGVNKEQAFYYHTTVLEYFLLAWVIGERSGSSFSGDFLKNINAMSSFVRDVTPLNGPMLQVGDSDDGFVTRFTLAEPVDPIRDILTAVDQCLGRDDWCRDATPGQKAFWYDLMLSTAEHRSSPAPEHTTSRAGYPIVYQHGGYAILGDDETHILFDAGELGYPSVAAHGHADALSFCLTRNGHPWVVDPGTYSYHSDHGWRDYFRGTQAHSTLTIDNRNQSEIGGPFMWLKKAQAHILEYGVDEQGCQYATGEHDGYQDTGVLCRRSVTYDAKTSRVNIIDTVRASNKHVVNINFHFHPDVTLLQHEQNSFLATRGDQEKSRILISVDPRFSWYICKGQSDPPLGWYSSRLGELRPTVTLHGVSEVTSNTELVTEFLWHSASL